jgi:superfamily II DNA or RNA helicase
MHCLLTKFGYVLEKDNLSEIEIEKIKESLTVKPFVLPLFKEFQKNENDTYTIFSESPKRLFVPRYYGINNFGSPVKNLLKVTENIQLKDNINLLPHQINSYNKTVDVLKSKGGGILSLPCGSGKCLGKDTPVMMYNGTFKMSQDIKPGDQLMGDDSSPRNVLTTCTGSEMLYKVIPIKGDSYVVNESHILSLIFSSNCTYKGQKYKKGDIIDMPLKEFISLPCHHRAYLRGYRVPVKFQHQDPDFDPYLLGYWLGYGNDEHNNDHFYQFLKKHNLLYNKHIPDLYKYNSRDIQLQVLAGIIDSDGYNQSDTVYELILKNEKLMDDIIFLCRSLGFACYKRKYLKTCNSKNPTNKVYYRICISGPELDKLPVKLLYKKLKPQTKNVLVTKIKVEKLSIGDYYGFTIDGNGRFLLGDFQVTHNTIVALKVIVTLKVKTIVLVNKEFLMDQWEDRIEHFIPEAKVGIIQQDKIFVEGMDIVIGMIHSVSKKDYDENVFKDFGLAIVDEVHHSSAKMFSKSLPKIACPYTLGLSATPERKDGLSYVFYYYLGDLFHWEKRTGFNNVIVKQLKLSSKSDFYLTKYRTVFGKEYKNTQAMVGQICVFKDRDILILEILKILVKQKRKILLLSDRREHVEYFNNELLPKASLRNSENKFVTYGLYYGKAGGTSRKDHKKMLEASSKCDIVLGTNMMASEALDIPDLNTLILTTPVTEVEQASGRILRKFHETINPVIVDLIDGFGNFTKHGKMREKYFKSEDYIIQSCNIDLDKNDYSDKLINFLENSDISNNLKEKSPKSKQKELVRGVCLIDADTTN